MTCTFIRQTTFFHINHYLKSVLKVALLHRFYFTYNWVGLIISYKITWAPSKDFDQPAHSCSLIEFAGHSLGRQGSKVSSGRQKRLIRLQRHRLIWAFAGCTCNLVGNTVPRLNGLLKCYIYYLTEFINAYRGERMMEPGFGYLHRLGLFLHLWYGLDTDSLPCHVIFSLRVSGQCFIIFTHA